MAMELMEGGTLRELQNRGPLKPEEAAALIMQLCLGIRDMHERGFVHRDIKPENIFCTKDRTKVKLGDLGCGMFLADGQQQEIAGSVPYIAPEVVMGQTATPQSDIYALGVIFYELLLGVAPFDNMFFEDFREMVTRGEAIVRWPDQTKAKTPLSLKRIVLKAAASAPAQRYLSAQEMLGDLTPFLSGHEQTLLAPGDNSQFSTNQSMAGITDSLELIKENLQTEAMRVGDLAVWCIDTFGREKEINEGLTKDMQEIIMLSLGESVMTLKNFYLGIEHIFLTLSSRKDSLFRQMLAQRGLNPASIGIQLRYHLKGTINSSRRNLFSPRLARVLKEAKAAHPDGVDEKAFLEKALREKCFATMILGGNQI
jgi:serine/threonine protein kinase